MTTLFRIAAARTVMASLVLVSVSAFCSAGIVSVMIDTQDAPNVVGGVNLGGLDLDDRQIANGDAQLSFLLTIDDTADTGTIWETTLTLAGTTNGAAAEVSVNPAGRITFSTAANRMDLLQLDIGPITQVSGPAGATAVFNGFDVIGMDQFNANNDLFDFGGDSYVGNVDGDTSNNASETFATQSLAPSGSLFDNTGAGQWRLEVISSQFDVSIATVPESSSVVLVSLLGLSFLRRKRV